MADRVSVCSPFAELSSSAWANYTSYYANWFKHGQAPTIVTDQWVNPLLFNYRLLISFLIEYICGLARSLKMLEHVFPVSQARSPTRTGRTIFYMFQVITFFLTRSTLVLIGICVPAFLTGPAQVSCFSGTNSNSTKALSGGVTELTVDLSPGSAGCSVSL